MNKKVTIALDAMGGDFGPPVTLPAALDALRRHPSLHWLIIGQQTVLEPCLSQLDSHLRQRLTVIDAPDVVLCSEQPAKALRRKRQSSMWLAVQQVADGAADACISAGNTGALMAMARAQLGTVPGVDRPALVAPLPALGRPANRGQPVQRTWLLDLGANINCDADALVQFAVMGNELAASCGSVTRPRIALLNVGSEMTKGSDQVRQAAARLSAMPHLNYVGYLEGHDLFSDCADVIVADGFAGNVALKTSEGLAQALQQRLSSGVGGSICQRIVAKMLKYLINSRLSDMNPDQYNGGSLLGLRGIVVKSHGHADQVAFSAAIDQAVAETERNVPERIAQRIETVLPERD